MQIFNDTHIAIFASGNGSNAINIIRYFEKYPQIRFTVLSNKADAPVLGKAQTLNVPTLTFNKNEFSKQTTVLDYLQANQVDYIVLAGFLWLVPTALVKAYPGKIVNIHPALLPNYGGKGMYGHFVHEAVIAAGETESGITIHYVNEHYDEGEVILQAKCPVSPNDTPDSLAQKIHALEHEHFPKVVEKLIAGN
jgi:phosphoribosylglycinamide formyltransferase 1